MTVDRRQAAFDVRVSAAETAKNRVHPEQLANGDEQKYACACYAMSFTKGLEHDPETGLVMRPSDYERFRRAIDDGFIDPFTANVPVPQIPASDPFVAPGASFTRRQWEAPTAGVAYDLEGPDAQAVTMPPAPALGSLELTYEMAEVYELAILRDIPFRAFDGDSEGEGDDDEDIADGDVDDLAKANAAVKRSVRRLNRIGYDVTGCCSGRPRKNVDGKLTPQTAFRGFSPGSDVGPYLSQFMLIGNDSRNGQFAIDEGYVQYGAQVVDQRVPKANIVNFMVDPASWLAVQNGVETRSNTEDNDKPGQQTPPLPDVPALFASPPGRRFITTPRDLATYVHDDALYQAYLNACLILLSMGTPFDPGFAQLSGRRDMAYLDGGSEGYGARRLNAGGFALYGGPHILSLVTEVATRALKAVRFQKFNNHIRLRPETLAGRLEHREEIRKRHAILKSPLDAMATTLSTNGGKGTLGAVERLNNAKNKQKTVFLPMAFQEGSPMHPAYGAGHATVAGACVTILKAFFDTGSLFLEIDGRCRFACSGTAGKAVAFLPPKTDDGVLDPTYALDEPLTLEGELNKLAANISIGRNMAGVHYFSDYFDSARMGEEIAIGILEEQALTYPTDPFVLSVPTFDGEVRRIGAR
ncbi:MAG: vanadium-dependent haloperoxidase [Pseudomonadota bacterium]